MHNATAAGLEQGNAMIDRIFKCVEGAFKEFHKEEARRLFRIRALMDPEGYPVYYYEELATSCSLMVAAKYRCKIEMEKVVEASNTLLNERQAISARDALYRTMKIDGMISILAPNGVVWELEKKDGITKDNVQTNAAKVIQKPRSNRGYIEFNRNWREGLDYIDSVVAIKNLGSEVKTLAEKLFIVCTIWNHKRFLLGEFKSLALVLVIIAAKDLGKRIDTKTVCNESFCFLNAAGIRYWMEKVTNCLIETEAVAMLNNPKDIRSRPWSAWSGGHLQKDQSSSSTFQWPSTKNRLPRPQLPLLKPESGWDEVDKANKPQGQLINGVWFP